MILLVALAAAVAAGLMGVTFLVARRVGNFSLVDIAWSFNFTPIAGVAALLGPGLLQRRVVVFVMVAVWSLRLAVHLGRRIAALHPVEEGRYIELRRKWAGHLDARFLQFFLLQGALNVILSIPFFFACLNVSPRIEPLESAGLVVFLMGVIGETVADNQLDAFKSEPFACGSVCRRGLWRYSRHPNYFFEWLVWCGYALIASAAPFGWISWICPALMLYFLLRVTGIPATEEQALRSRGEAYRAYQRSTSAFMPWFPKSDAL